MVKKRRFRIRTKHYERTMVILMIAAFIVIGRAIYLKNHPASGRSLASIESRPASVQTAQIKLSVLKFVSNVQKALGPDDVGKLAFRIFLRNIAPASKTSDWKIAKLCISDNYCPVPLKQLYEQALSRLSPQKFAYVRINLQAQMLKSQMPTSVKRAILINALEQAKANQMSSTIDANGKIHLSTLTDYNTLTLVQLESLKPMPKEFMQTALHVVRSSRDTVGNKYMMQALARSYPQFRNEISAQASQMGMNLAAR